MPVKNEQQTEIRVAPSLDPSQLVRATATLFAPMPYAPGSDGARRGGVAPVGRCVRVGQLVPISDPIVRKNIEFFTTVERPLRLDDLPEE